MITKVRRFISELSIGWVDPWVGLDRVTQNGPMDNSGLFSNTDSNTQYNLMTCLDSSPL